MSWQAAIGAVRGAEGQGVPVSTAMGFAKVAVVVGTVVHSSPGYSLRRRRTPNLSVWIGQVEEVGVEVAKTLLIETAGAVSPAPRLTVRGPRSAPPRKTLHYVAELS